MVLLLLVFLRIFHTDFHGAVLIYILPVSKCPPHTLTRICDFVFLMIIILTAKIESQCGDFQLPFGNFIHVYNLFWLYPSPASLFLFQLPLFTPLSTPCLLFKTFYNPLSPISAACMRLSAGPSNASWQTYQPPHPPFSYQLPIVPQLRERPLM